MIFLGIQYAVVDARLFYALTYSKCATYHIMVSRNSEHRIPHISVMM